MTIWKNALQRMMLSVTGPFNINLDNAYSSQGCGLPLPEGLTPGGNSTNFTIPSSGGIRSYLLYIPLEYQIHNPAPLVFSFHGNDRNSSEQEALSQFSDPTVNQNAIAVYPQGLHNSWQGAPYSVQGVSDMQFMSDLIASLESTYCIDTTRIYAAGKSNGGGFVSALACNSTLSSQIAAFAPVSGAFYENAQGTTPLDGPCIPNKSRSSIPILEFHGQEDDIIPYNGDASRHNFPLPPIPSWLGGRAFLNGCENGILGNSSFFADGVVNKTTWTCGGQDAIVTGYWIKGLKHWWPSTEPNDDNPDHPTVLNASSIILNFFGQHTLRDGYTRPLY